jgi:hypothetical protein
MKLRLIIALVLILNIGIVPALIGAPSPITSSDVNTGLAGWGNKVQMVAGGEVIFSISSKGKITGSDGRVIGWLNKKETLQFNKSFSLINKEN